MKTQEALSLASEQKKNRGLWIVGACLSLVLLSFALVRPEWAGRLTATTLIIMFATIFLFVYGVHPRSEFLDRKSKIARCGSEQTKKVTRRVIRFLVIIFAMFFLSFCAVPLIQDSVQTLIHGHPYLLEVRGRVQSDDFLFGLYFIKQDIRVIKDDETSGTLYVACFFPRLAREGVTYRFLVAPKSGMILDWSKD